ncbi:MAG: hypothetical protein HY028_12020 [Gammaproteobacteria bacterium]|nr:hypothetical protein [Gammaproteobacteria bacterium]
MMNDPSLRWRMALSILLIVFIIPSLVYARAGDLDSSFGNNGVVFYSPFEPGFAGGSVVVLPDGKIMGANSQYSSATGYDFSLTRLNANGTLDTGFGNGGSVRTDLGYSESPSAILRQPDGKLVVAGTAIQLNVLGEIDFALVRYNTDGSLDTGFGNGGKVITDFAASQDYAHKIALLEDGRLVVAGVSFSPVSSDSYTTLARYQADGKLDTSFGVGGKVTTLSSGGNEIGTLAVQPDDKLIVARSTQLVRYHPDGRLDESFGVAGKVDVQEGNAVTIQPDGKILIAGAASIGSGNSAFVLAHYTANGILDSGFGNAGQVITDFTAGSDSATAVALQPDGKIIVAGIIAISLQDGIFGVPPPCAYGGALGLARYDANGGLDTTFGDGGKIITASVLATGVTISVAADNKIILAGGLCSDIQKYNFTLTRYLNDSGLPQPGWWWNPNESGRGFSVEVSQNTLFMAGYLYDTSGRATWYTSAGPITNNTLYQGILQSFGNGQTLSGPYKSYALTNPNAGNVTVQLSDATHGTLTWPGGTIPIERYTFGAGTPSFQPEAGWWWSDSESGRGFTLEVQGNKLFIGGYMYDDQGNPVWYISAGNMTSATLYQGQWEQYANGQTLTGLYQKPTQVNANVGNITIEFTSRTTATLTLPDGRQIPLTRYRF